MKYAIKNPSFRNKLENININKFDIYHGEVFDYVRFNNIKFEIKPNQYTIGFGASTEPMIATTIKSSIRVKPFFII